jgi:hypothetical protein
MSSGHCIYHWKSRVGPRLDNFTRCRVSNWEDLAILRPFEDSVLKLRVDEELTEYDEVLKHMDSETWGRVAME